MNDKIDVVITWVNGNDFKWLEEKNKWYKKLNPDAVSNSSNRYQSWDNLKYWFRAIEKYMPWVNKVFFITWGHIPDFLDTDNPKIRIIKHSDYIPERFLPTFNSRTIELNIHRINELSENFIYFNDDMFPLQSFKEDFFFVNNTPCDEAIETPIIPVASDGFSKFIWNVRAIGVSVINKNFKKRYVHKKFHDKWFNDCYGELLERNKSLEYWDNFVGFRDPHMAVSYNKSTFRKVWEHENELLEKTCLSKFRSIDTVNQWIIRYWQLCEGNFIPRKPFGKSYVVTIDNYNEIANDIMTRKDLMICINEKCTERDFEIIKERINSGFETILPERSSFEK